jgi:uncharacterized membrane protein YedE/YeeE
MRNLLALVAGGLFGAGLLISGMTNTTKVQGWLDVFGDWDPTLAFVLGGAIIPMFFAWRYAEARGDAILGGAIPQKSDPQISNGLAVGSVLFGAGWGLSGLCPGPSLASLGFGGWQGILFLVAMSAGMFATPTIRNRFSLTT